MVGRGWGGDIVDQTPADASHVSDCIFGVGVGEDDLDHQAQTVELVLRAEVEVVRSAEGETAALSALDLQWPRLVGAPEEMRLLVQKHERGVQLQVRGTARFRLVLDLIRDRVQILNAHQVMRWRW